MKSFTLALCLMLAIATYADAQCGRGRLLGRIRARRAQHVTAVQVVQPQPAQAAPKAAPPAPKAAPMPPQVYQQLPQVRYVPVRMVAACST